jgi:TRAP transporter 4TM/12TM fusion protein
LAVVANVVAIFIVLGAILRVTGTGDLFIDLAFILTGRFVGGPAQTAVISSAFFGSINGSGPANVVSTGSFTIPLMKRCGYKPAFAGAVEATASCVGQIMPPIMGVGAFLMAEITGIPYGRIMLAAIVPALLYSISLLFNVRFQALRQGIKALPEDQVPRFQKAWIPRIMVLVATTGVLLWKILSGTAPNMAGFSAVVTLTAGAFLVKEIRPNFKRLVDMAVEGGKDLLSLTMACSAIGIVIGGLSITGLGVKFSQAIISVGQSNLLLALVMAAFCCIIVGMGLPTAASYLMVVFIAAPAITKLGLPLLTTHLFIFYFAVLSAISPPVALNAYAASGIAKSDPLMTGFYAVRLGAIGFVLPFLWVYNPQLMLGEGNLLVTLVTITACLLAVLALAAANTGYLCRNLRGHERLIILAAGVLLATPNVIARVVGLGLGLASFFYFKKTEVSDLITESIGG